MACLNIFLVVVAIREFKVREKNNMRSPEQSAALRSLFNEKEDIKVKRFQITVLAWGLLIYTVIFVAISLLGDFLIYTSDGLFKCKHNMFFQPLSHTSALFIMTINYLSVSPSLLLWYVIYFIPKKYGKLSRNVFKNEKLRVLAHYSEGPSSCSLV